jgi:hypothetical protein
MCNGGKTNPDMLFMKESKTPQMVETSLCNGNEFIAECRKPKDCVHFNHNYPPKDCN